MLDDATVQDLQRHWDEGWNAGDLATIMAPFAADVVFSSPFVPRLTGDPAKTTISGYDALRGYVDAALRLAYTCHLPDGTVKHGADSMRVNAAGQVAEWRCHYSRDSL